MRSMLIALVLLGCPGSVSAPAAEPIVTTDLLRIRTITAIDVARDGSRAVFALRSIATIPPADANDPLTQASYKYQSHLYLIDLNTPSPTARQITFGERNDASPRFSPDGKRIAFVRAHPSSSAPPQNHRPSRPAEDHHFAQVWIMPIDGGEARQVTNFPPGCGEPVWSPEGRRLLVCADLNFGQIDGVPVYPTERPKRAWKDAALPAGVAPRPDGSREQIRAWLERNATALNPIVIDRLEFQDEHALRGVMRFQHLYLLEPDSPAALSAPITQQNARRITNGFFDHQQPVFMPDGQSIVYVSKKPADQHPDRALDTSLWRINADGSNDRKLLAIDGWSVTSPRPSRDGSVIAFTGAKNDEPAFRQTQLGIASIKGDAASDPVWLTDEATFRGSVDSFEWMQAQPALVFNAAMRGGFPLMTVSPGLIQPAPLIGESDGRPIGINTFAIGGGEIVYTMTSISNPCTLKARDARGERTLFDPNSWLAGKTLSTPSEGMLTRPDGTRIQHWLMEPANREPGKKYPLVLAIHGGPAAMWGPGESSMWHEFQLLCSWGFGVAYGNPRGSGGYGYEFQKKNFQDWGEGPGGDALAIIDEALLKDWVDRDRLVVTGGSYAGYLTVWIIAHDHRFKAAVAQRGVYDFDTFFGEGNAWRLVPWAMGGVPYDPRFRSVLDRHNLLNYVQRIRTPLLIKHGSNDLRTGVAQSEMLYRALKDQSKPVEYLRYPGAGHDLSRSGDPLQRMDRLNRLIEFFERYVANDRPAPLASSN